MPHQCTDCERVFGDGSKEMLSGCPNCGGNTFQYLPESTTVVPDEQPPDRPGSDSTVAKTVGRAATSLRDAVTGGSGRSSDDGASDRSSDHGDAGPEPATPEDSSVGGAGTDDGAEVRGRNPDEAPSGNPDTQTPSERADPDGSTNRNPDPIPAEEDPRTDAEFVDGDPPEDYAQSSARTDVVSDDELPGGMAGFGNAPEDGRPTAGDGDPVAGDGDQTPGDGDPAVGSPDSTAQEAPPVDESEGRVVDTPSPESPGIDELREELNDQFEGIRIVERGKYELNVMELYEREETIIALKENGRYVIEPPESWRGDA
jgi:predicted  nucleic acid-binding Zn-ribbon protein